MQIALISTFLYVQNSSSYVIIIFFHTPFMTNDGYICFSIIIMSFSFSQNLLSDIPSSQGSHSDSSQPLTQPMMGYNMPTSSRQNFTLPRPPSCPNLTRNSTSSFYSHDQQRAKYSRVEKTSTDKAALGDTLREVQVRLSSVPSSCSRMLEEGLVFLEGEITKENEMTMASVRSMTDVIETVSHLSQGNNCGETVKIMKSAVKTSIEMVESVKKVLDTVQEDQKNTARVIDIIEDRLQNLKNDNIELLDKLREANRGSNNLTEKVKKIVDEEAFGFSIV